MSYIMVDVEADGPIPGDYSMVSFGAIVVEPSLSRTFYGQLKPISEKWIPEALAVSGFSREETLGFDDPQTVMQNFANWIGEHSKDRPQFISDNNGFDWQFINLKLSFTSPLYKEPRLVELKPKGFRPRKWWKLQAPAEDRPHPSPGG